MANAEHVDLVRRGGNKDWAQWERWRRDHATARLDLSDADLTGVNMSSRDLGRADLRRASLRGATLARATLVAADLTCASLVRAILTAADLTGATLIEADLTSASMDSVDLTDATLTGATLFQAVLRRAVLARAELSAAELSEAVLVEADLTDARLYAARLLWANLARARLASAGLTGANLAHADLTGADLGGANLARATLSDASLMDAILAGADLTGATCWGAAFLGADLSRASLIDADFRRSDMTRSRVFGTAAWRIALDRATQRELVITDVNEATITIDDLQVAQFVYVLVNNRSIRTIIDTIASKVVLILGRFAPCEHMSVLNALRDALRAHDYLPVVFDVEGPRSRDLTETVRTLAHISRFIVADLTDPRSIPHELMAIVPMLPSVPVRPVIHKSQDPWAMFEHLRRYPWVLEPYSYESAQQLVDALMEEVIAPAEAKAAEVAPRSPRRTK